MTERLKTHSNTAQELNGVWSEQSTRAYGSKLWQALDDRDFKSAPPQS
ncbi:MAG TPA: hypothetical protein VHZ55_21985 [Bryobacteraceae bacterium]|nr:hypothetical protein [Bryobacteraceae bacterium]